MSYIGKEPQFTQYPSKFFNGDGTAMTVTLDYSPPNAAALLVFIDGVRQDTSAYTLSGTSLTFTGTVPSGTNNVQVVHLGLTQDVGVPSDDTISTVKIQDNAITTVKIQDDAVTSAKLDTNIAIDGDLTVDTNTLHVDSTNNRVGVGTSSPVSMLQVGDETTSNTLITVESANNTLAGIDLMGDLSGSKGFRIKYEGNGNYFAIEDNTSSVLTERIRIDVSGNLQFDSGFGSTATAYGCRAWCFWHQNGTQSIYGSANISSITDLGVGITQLNFTNAMPDANYSAPVTTNSGSYSNSGTKTTTSFRVTTLNNALGAYDAIVADTIVLR
jgi:hypothetical protein